MNRKPYDFVIIGSGFGGSVSAMRLSAKGYSVALVEQGRRWSAEEFPKSNWNIRKFFWFPRLKFFGPQSIVLMKGLMALRGVGVGGGSLVYANTLMKPADSVLSNQDWPQNINWRLELEKPYQEAERMLGVTEVPKLFASDKYLESLSKEQNRHSTFHPTRVAVYFGENSDSLDPYFEGKGPSRKPCNFCGACMIGCPNGSKNTLDKNYLYFAEKNGAEVIELSKAEKIVASSDVEKPGYFVEIKDLENGKTTSVFGQRVIVAAGTVGTIELLLKNKVKHKTLEKISEQLGKSIRTNGESLVGVTQIRGDDDFSKGVAIGSAYHPDDSTKIEAVRYPHGSGAMRLLAVPMTGPGGKWLRPLRFFLGLPVHLLKMLRMFLVSDWAKSSMILLVMKTTNHTMKFGWKSRFWGDGMTGEPEGESIPSYMEVAQQSGKILAKLTDGIPQNATSEVLLGATATAHLLGGCRMGESQENGVVDFNHQVFNYPGLFVCDGSVIPTNLGVNPSLTITALAERFTNQFKSRT